MTNLEFVKYTQSFDSVKTMSIGSEAYINTIGLLRTLYKISDDPVAITTLNNKEVWGKVDFDWTKYP